MISQSRVAQILMQLLKEKDMRVTELSRQVNLPQPTVYRIATGVCQNPHISSLQPIADFFSISVNQLRGLDPIHAIDHVKKIPLLSWQELTTIKLHNKKVLESHPLILTDANLSSKAFALRIEDTSLEPLFLHKTILIIDPDKQPKDRSYVILKLHNAKKPVLRQLLINEDQQLLKTLACKPEKISPLKKQDSILGTLIQAKSIFYEE